MRYIYNNIAYSSFEEVPFEKSDLALFKNIGKPRKVRDKRSERIQYCYSKLVQKGLFNLPATPDPMDTRGCELYYYKIGSFLDIEVKNSAYGIHGSETIDRYREPLKAAIQLYLYLSNK